MINNAQHITCGIANKGFRGMRRFVARLNVHCNLIGNRPQSLTGHTRKRWAHATARTDRRELNEVSLVVSKKKKSKW